MRLRPIETLLCGSLSVTCLAFGVPAAGRASGPFLVESVCVYAGVILCAIAAIMTFVVAIQSLTAPATRHVSDLDGIDKS